MHIHIPRLLQCRTHSRSESLRAFPNTIAIKLFHCLLPSFDGNNISEIHRMARKIRQKGLCLTFTIIEDEVAVHRFRVQLQSGDENGTLNPVEDPAIRGTSEPVNAYKMRLVSIRFAKTPLPACLWPMCPPAVKTCDAQIRWSGYFCKSISQSPPCHDRKYRQKNPHPPP